MHNWLASRLLLVSKLCVFSVILYSHRPAGQVMALKRPLLTAAPSCRTTPTGRTERDTEEWIRGMGVLFRTGQAEDWGDKIYLGVGFHHKMGGQQSTNQQINHNLQWSQLKWPTAIWSWNELLHSTIQWETSKFRHVGTDGGFRHLSILWCLEVRLEEKMFSSLPDNGVFHNLSICCTLWSYTIKKYHELCFIGNQRDDHGEM